MAMFSDQEPMLKGPKRQHYIPRFYLKGFARNNLFTVFDRNAQTFRRQPTGGTACEGYFYNFTDREGRSRYEVEHFFSMLEGEAAKALGKVANKVSLTGEDLHALALFIATTAIRTPDHIESVKYVQEQTMKRVCEMTFSNKETAKAAFKQSNLSFSSDVDSDAEIDKVMEFVDKGEYEFEVDRQYAMGLALNQFESIASMLLNRTWVIVHCESDRSSFITSDSPVVLTTVEDRADSFWGVGYANSDALVVMPLTQSCAVMIFGQGDDLHHVDVNHHLVRRINQTVADASKRFVMARDEALLKSIVHSIGLQDRKWSHKYGVS